MLKHRSGIGLAAQILQRQDLQFRRITLIGPSLIVVREGAKTFDGAQGKVTVHAGGAMALAGGQVCDVTNHVGRTGVYRATALGWDEALLAGMQGRIATSPMRPAAALPQIAPGFAEAVDAAVTAITDPRGVPQAVARHRLQEVLLWLDAAGVAFPEAGPKTLGQSLMLRIATRPGEDWSVAQVAAQLCLSEGTLRRRLAEEGTGLRELVTETRMNAALTLLQTSDAPVGQIAADLGYDSASRFTARFRARFGFAPSQIRLQKRA